MLDRRSLVFDARSLVDLTYSTSLSNLTVLGVAPMHDTAANHQWVGPGDPDLGKPHFMTVIS